MTLSNFFEEGREQSIVLVKPAARLRSEGNGITMESLGIGLQNQQLEPFLIKVAAGAGNIDQPVSHPGEEFVYCLEGEIDYCVGDRIFTLGPEHSLLFEATIPHCFRNKTERPALLMMVFRAGNGDNLARSLHLDFSAKEDAGEEDTVEDVTGSDS